MNRKVYIKVVLFVLLIVILIYQDPAPKQIVVPSCFEQKDCREPVKQGFCGIEYDCVVGRCYTEDVLCPELCGSGNDEDLDGLFDCEDPDCYDDWNCHCSRASFNECLSQQCFCPGNQLPIWEVEEEGNCICR